MRFGEVGIGAFADPGAPECSPFRMVLGQEPQFLDTIFFLTENSIKSNPVNQWRVGVSSSPRMIQSRLLDAAALKFESDGMPSRRDKP